MFLLNKKTKFFVSMLITSQLGQGLCAIKNDPTVMKHIAQPDFNGMKQINDPSL